MREEAEAEIKRTKALAALNTPEEIEKAKMFFRLLPQGPDSGLDADMVDGLHAEEIIAKAKPLYGGGGGGGGGDGGGMQVHGNEYHEPDFAEKEHTHPCSELTDHDKATHDALGIDAATLEGSAKAEVQDHAPKAHDINPDEGPHTGGLPLAKVEGHTKTAHDALGIDAATLEGSDKAAIQDHDPNAHTHTESEITDLDHDAQKIKGKTVDDTAIGDKKLLVYNATGTKLEYKAIQVVTTLTFAVVGTLAVGTDKAPTILAPCSLTITEVKLVVKTAPTGQAIIVDVNKNGTTIFTTQANRPQIADGETTGDSGTPDVTSLTEGDKITIDIDQVGSTEAGADLTVEVLCKQAVVVS